jgi:uncharacterized membrane protein
MLHARTTPTGMAAWVLGLDMAASGVARLRTAAPFDALLPSRLPAAWRSTITRTIGVLELVSFVLLVVPRHRPTGARLTGALLALILPANLAAARRGGYPGLEGWAGSTAATWLRVVLHPAAMWLSWRLARPAGSVRSTPATWDPPQ